MRDIQPSLSFLGGAGTVTGSKYLIQAFGSQVLLDAGLFQGLKELRLRNWAKPAFDPKQLSAVVLSHAHIDHSGYLPVLHKNHFHGKVFCTHGTADLLQIMLPDSAYLQEEEAAHANRKGYSKHHPALALCTIADAEAVLKQVKHYPYGKLFEVRPGLQVIYRRAGHILGSATVELQIRRKGAEPLKLVFSGDLGRWQQPILRDPEPVPEADILLLESTYGNRMHSTDAVEKLAQIIREAAQRGGALIIPAFAIGRTQQLVWTIRKLEEEGKIPVLPVYVDSPMAISASEIYHRHPEDHDLDMRKLTDENQSPLNSKNFRVAKTPAESQALNSIQGPMIIISASGMATGGRILYHLKKRLPDAQNTVLLPGYQAAGTRGRLLQEGAKTVRIHGQEIAVNAKVEVLDGFSAHADQNEILKWLGYFKRPPKVTYLVHGEPESLKALQAAIQSKLKWNVEIAQDGFTVPLI